MNWQLMDGRTRRRWRGDEGQDLVEYGILAGLIAVAAVGAIQAFGAFIKTSLWDVVAKLL